MKTKHRLSEKLNKNSVSNEQLVKELHAELRAVHLELERLFANNFQIQNFERNLLQ